MPTKPRNRSESGFYHVFQRGVCLFDIFEDDDDREFYLERLFRYAVNLGVEIHAWCLMSNHTHLLLRAGFESLSALMRMLGSTYARRFNMRHGRTGPLFEGRFGSVPVETDAQFLSVVRYIHRNPIHHEERTLMGDYQWSSYGEYVAAAPKFCQVEFTLNMFGSMEEFVRFHEEERDFERHLDVGSLGRLSDDEARELANRVLSKNGFNVAVTGIGSLPKSMRDKAIAHVVRSVGCSLRQLQRLTAIAYSAIRVAANIGREAMAHEKTRREGVESPISELRASFEELASSGVIPSFYSAATLPSP